ncbi:MAG: PHP domain-containing protein [Bacteroidales bacterium]|nr:PHP domain-containing protein [Bacteroidales bacterium]
MPRGSPFTRLCRQAAERVAPIVADLHTHTTASDGDATPSQLVQAASRAKLRALAITDHDTLAGVEPARQATQGLSSHRLTIIPGVEISASFAGREIHILGLFVRTDVSEFQQLLNAVCQSRRERFRDYLQKIPELQPAQDAGLAALIEAGTASLGRRHVARLLIQTGVAKQEQEAFVRFLHPITPQVLPKQLIPAETAIAAIRAAGGISSLAHPPESFVETEFDTLRAYGLDGIEVRFPAATPGRTQRLLTLAARYGFLMTAGSDSHNPTPGGRLPGSLGVTATELLTIQSHRSGS